MPPPSLSPLRVNIPKRISVSTYRLIASAANVSAFEYSKYDKHENKFPLTISGIPGIFHSSPKIFGRAEAVICHFCFAFST